MQFTLFRLKFTTPLHISNVRSDYAKSENIIHSDTLYSAIFEAWSKLGITEQIEKQSNQLQFTLSSLFPFTIDNKTNNYVYFFPKPLNLSHKKVNEKKHKDFKKIKYVDKNFLEKYRNGYRELNDDSFNLVKGQYLTGASIDTNFMSSEVFPRVTIPRQGGDATPYYVERIFFNKNSGLFFIAQFDNDEIKNYVISALLYLSNEGIGTDRHVGNGFFKFEEDKIDFEPITSDYAINLSLYCPSAEIVKNIINDDNVAYEVITRGGWITTPQYNTLRKKYIRMFKEASILKINNLTAGRIIDITPDKTILPETAKNIHPIYRIGKSLFLTIKI